MKPDKSRLLFSFFIFLFSLFFAACDYDTTGGGTGNYQRFDWDLRGTWATNDPDSRHTGTLVIDYNRITITGYSETQTPAQGGNDTERPFRGFTKNTPLSAYSEEGKFFITDAGIVQEGIPYTYWEGTRSPPDFKKAEFLRFTFGGRQETLRKQFDGANLEAHFHFNNCPKCGKWVCDDCFCAEVQGGVCRDCC